MNGSSKMLRSISKWHCLQCVRNWNMCSMSTYQRSGCVLMNNALTASPPRTSLSKRTIRKDSGFLLNVSFPYSKTRNIFTTSSQTQARTCWKCGRDTNPNKELFFCECGIVQEPANNLTFFKLLQVEQSFNVDIPKLSQQFKDNQRRLHPDKYSTKSKMELQLAEEQSSLLNKSYYTLLKPLSRAIYLLELDGVTISENDSVSDPEFLMDMMEYFETIESASSPDEVESLDKSNNTKIEKTIQELSSAFDNKDLTSAKNLTIRLRYFTTIQDRIKELRLQHFGQ